MTGNGINNEFDLKLRSVLESGSEAVPAGLWDGVSRRLPAAGGASRRPVYLRVIRLSAGLVAASSLAVGVVFTSRHQLGSGRLDILSVGPTLTDVPTLSSPEVSAARKLPGMSARVPCAISTVTAEEPANTGEPLITVKDPAVTASAEPTANTSDPAVISALGAAGLEQAAPAVEPSSAAREGSTSSTELSSDIDDNFPGEAGETRRARRPGVSFGAFTNAASNGTSTKAGAAMMKRAGAIGGNSTPQTSVTETSSPTFGIPVSAGLGVKINFTDRWALGVGINYSYLTSRFDGVYTKDDGTSDCYSGIRNELHYIGIPVNVYYTFVSSDIVDVYTFAGGSIEKGLSNKYRMVSPETGTLIHKEKIGGLQYSAGLGLGVEFNLARHFSLYVDPSIRYYFNSGQPLSIRTRQPFLAQIDLGFRLNF